MIRGTRVAVVLFALMMCGFAGATRGQAPSSKPAYKHDGKIDVTFDESKNETTVRLDTMKIYGGEAESLSMVVVGSYAGKTPQSPPSELLVVLSVSSNEKRFQFEPMLVITADGEIVRNRLTKKYASRVEGDRVIEPLFNMIPYDVLVKMANAKKVTLKIGVSEYEMTANNMEALKDVISRMVP